MCTTDSGGNHSTFTRIQISARHLSLYPLLYYLLGWYRKSQLQMEYATHRPTVLKPRLDELASCQNASTSTDAVYWLDAALRQVTNFVNEETLNTTVLFGKEDARLLLCDMVQVVFSLYLTRQITDKFSQMHSSMDVVLDMFHRLDGFAKEFTLTVREAGIDKLFETYSVVYRACYDFLVQYPEHESSGLKAHFTREIEALNVALASAEEEQDFDFDAKPSDATAAGPTASGVATGSSDRLRINRSSGRLAGGHMVAHPEESLAAFSQRFYSSADQLLPAIQAVLVRSSLFMGGLSLKLTFRYVGGIFSSYIKFLSYKIDELRQACGFTATDRISSAGGPIAGSLSGGADNLFALDQTVSKGVIQTYARQIEVYGLNEKELVPAALLMLLTLGKLTLLAKDLDHFLSGIFSGLSGNLTRDYKASFQSFLATAASTTTITNMSAFSASASFAKSGSSVLGSKLSQIYTNFVLQNNFDQLSEFKSFLSIYSSNARHNTQTLSYVVSSSLQRLRTISGLFLFELSTNSIQKLLVNYSLDDAASTGHIGLGSRTNMDDNQQLSLDNFLPQPLITQVGEHLLSLFQEFDAFPTMERVLEMRALLGEAHALTLGSTGWARIKEQLALSKEDDSVDTLCRRANCSSVISTFETSLFGAPISVIPSVSPAVAAYTSAPRSDSDADGNDSENKGESDADQADSAEETDVASSFVNEWLGAIADSVVGVFVLQVLRLDTLSPAGSAQLCVDLDYLRYLLNYKQTLYPIFILFCLTCQLFYI